MMPDLTRILDYAKARTAALQRLAAGGDPAAQRELLRRGAGPELPADLIDVTTLDEVALRRLVRAWRDGRMPEDRARNRTLAAHALAELELRHRVDVRLWQAASAAERRRMSLPQPPAPAPWLAPRPPRVQTWRRPARSTLYPSEIDVQREQLEALATATYDDGSVTR